MMLIYVGFALFKFIKSTNFCVTYGADNNIWSDGFFPVMLKYCE